MTFFLPTYQRNNFYIEDFVYILVICETTRSDRARVLKYQLECDKVQWLQTHCGQALIFLGKSVKYLKSPHFFKPGQGIWAKKFTHAHHVFQPWMSNFISVVNACLMQMLWLNFILGLHLFIFLCYYYVYKYINVRKENGVLNQAKRKPQHKDNYIIKE